MRHRPDALMIFAAGLGTRMRPLTDICPKPLIEVCGKPLIDHALELAAGAGIGRIVVNTHHMAGQIEEHLRHRRGVFVSREEPELLDTGGGLRQALPLLKSETVFTLNSDSVWSGANPLAELAAAWDPQEMDALLLLVPKERATGHKGPGDFLMAEDGRLTRGLSMVYTGAQIIKTEGLAETPERAFSLNLLWDAMLLDERVYGIEHRGGWCDVGQPESLALAENMLRGCADV